MRLDAERRLWDAIAAIPTPDWGKPRDRRPREIIEAMVADGSIESEKQAWRTLEKWSRRRLYEYGVALDLGWLVEGAEFPRRQ